MPAKKGKPGGVRLALSGTRSHLEADKVGGGGTGSGGVGVRFPFRGKWSPQPAYLLGVPGRTPTPS